MKTATRIVEGDYCIYAALEGRGHVELFFEDYTTPFALINQYDYATGTNNLPTTVKELEDVLTEWLDDKDNVNDVPNYHLNTTFYG